MLPTRVIAVDWSGARVGAERKIWLAECEGGELTRLCSGWTRESVTAELVRLTRHAQAREERLVVGLDFSFGFPAWYAAANGWTSGRAVWRAFPGDRVDAMLAQAQPPFWGRGEARRRPAGLHDDSATPPLRETERQVQRAHGGARPFSVFQLVGAGSVGVGSLRGMATLHALAEAGACVWPFDTDAGGAGAVIVEIWPRLCAPHVVKSQAAARVAHVQALAARLPSAARHISSVRESDDAFDALVGAAAMWQSREALRTLPGEVWEGERIEGRIWAP